MSYQTERSAIEAYIGANWTATGYGLDGHTYEPEIDTVQFTIQSGERLQGSMGRVQNVIYHVGLLTCTIHTEGGKGSAKWRGYAESLIDLFHGVTLDSVGAPITSTADAFLRFSPVGPQGRVQQHPYVSGSYDAAPFHVTTISAPFVRYDLK